jgi:hypothetical protein
VKWLRSHLATQLFGHAAKWRTKQQHIDYCHIVDTHRASRTGRCKHYGNLCLHVPTFFQATGSTARARQVPRAVKASRHPMRCMQVHASSNWKLGSMIRSLTANCWRNIPSSVKTGWREMVVAF